MHPTSVSQPCINERHRIVEPPTDGRGQALGELAYVAFAWEPEIGQLEAGAAIDEHLVRAVDQDICHPRLMQQRFQKAGTDAVSSQRLHGVEYG
jgi:hypothetical protein